MQTFNKMDAARILDEIGRIGLDECFQEIVKEYPLSTAFLMEMGIHLDLYSISNLQRMEPCVYRKYRDSISWNGVINHIFLDSEGMNFVIENLDKFEPGDVFNRLKFGIVSHDDDCRSDCVNLTTIVKYYISKDLMTNRIWDKISSYDYLDPVFIREFNYHLNWTILTHHNRVIPLDLLIQYIDDELDWKCIWNNYNFNTEELIQLIDAMEEKGVLVDWWSISVQQRLDEEFINTHTDNVIWNAISQYQNMTLEFMQENADNIRTPALMSNIAIPSEIRSKYLLWLDERAIADGE